MPPTIQVRSALHHRGSTSVDRRVKEGPAESQARWARDRGGYEGRRASNSAAFATDRDLTPVELERARRNSRRNYKTSGIFGAMVDQAVCHVIGDGITITFEDEKLGKEVLAQLNAPRNRFLRRIDELFRRWIVDGEGVVTFRSLMRDGKVPTGDTWIGLKDPNQIGDFQVDGWNDERILAIQLPITYNAADGVPPPDAPRMAWIPAAEPTFDGEMPEGFPLPRYAGDGKPKEAGPGSATMHALYMRLNALGARGVPLYSRSVDKVTLLDLLVDHLMAKAEYTNRHWLHVKYKQKDNGGASDRAFEKRMLKWATQGQPGEAAVTSDDVTVQVLAPDLKLIDQKALYDIGVGYILGSHSMPRVWFGESSGDRSGAAEAGSPIYRLLKGLQSRLRDVVEDVVRFLITLAKASKRVAKTAEERFTVVVSEFATRDSVRDVQELTWAGNAFDAAVLNQSISPEERQKMIRKIIGTKPFGSELSKQAPALVDPNAAAALLGASMLPIHRDGERPGAPAIDPEAKAPMPTEMPGAAGSPPAGLMGTLPSTGQPRAPTGGAPAAPAAAAPAGGAQEVQKTALNGAQIAAVVDLLAKVQLQELNPEAAKATLALSFPGYDLSQIETAIEAAAKEGEAQAAARQEQAAELAEQEASAAAAAAKEKPEAPPAAAPKPTA